LPTLEPSERVGLQLALVDQRCGVDIAGYFEYVPAWHVARVIDSREHVERGHADPADPFRDLRLVDLHPAALLQPISQLSLR